MRLREPLAAPPMTSVTVSTIGYCLPYLRCSRAAATTVPTEKQPRPVLQDSSSCNRQVQTVPSSSPAARARVSFARPTIPGRKSQRRHTLTDTFILEYVIVAVICPASLLWVFLRKVYNDMFLPPIVAGYSFAFLFPPTPGKPPYKLPRTPPFKLTYAFLLDYLERPAEDIELLQRAIVRAFSNWAEGLERTITFSEVPAYYDAKPDIEIKFAPLPPPNEKKLALSTGPRSPTARITFNSENITWYSAECTDEPESKKLEFAKDLEKVPVDLETVAVHEIGHTLGLGHSLDDSTVMYDHIPRTAVKRRPMRADILGVLALYGIPPPPLMGKIVRR